MAFQLTCRRSSTVAVRPATARIWFPNANSSVPPESSQGTRRINVCCGVLSSSSAPAQPPATLVTSSGIRSRSGTLSLFRYATVLAANPGHRATVFVAFAGTGGTPLNSNTGNDTKLPPPATAFSVPAMTAPKNSRIAWLILKRTLYQKPARAAKSLLLKAPERDWLARPVPEYSPYSSARAFASTFGVSDVGSGVYPCFSALF